MTHQENRQDSNSAPNSDSNLPKATSFFRRRDLNNGVVAGILALAAIGLICKESFEIQRLNNRIDNLTKSVARGANRINKLEREVGSNKTKITSQ